MEKRNTIQTTVITPNLYGVSGPVPQGLETIEIEVDISGTVADEYMSSLYAEMMRIDPEVVRNFDLTPGKLQMYFEFLLRKRVEYVHQECREWRQYNQFWIPAYFQQALSYIGEVLLYEDGWRLVPVLGKNLAAEINFLEATEVSNILMRYRGRMQVLNNAFPRSTQGEKDVMCTILIDDHVRGMTPVSLVQSTYISALLNSRLVDEIRFASHFRQFYDDVDLIATGVAFDSKLY